MVAESNMPQTVKVPCTVEGKSSKKVPGSETRYCLEKNAYPFFHRPLQILNKMKNRLCVPTETFSSCCPSVEATKARLNRRMLHRTRSLLLPSPSSLQENLNRKSVLDLAAGLDSKLAGEEIFERKGKCQALATANGPIT